MPVFDDFSLFFEKILISLYESKDTVSTINEVLRLVGERFELGRIYIFEDKQNGSWCENTFEWCGEGVLPRKKDLSHVDYAALGGKQDFLALYDSRGVLFCPDPEKLPEALVKDIRPQGIRALLQCLILDGGEVIGFMGFDDLGFGDGLSEKLCKLLTVFARLLGTYLVKERMGDLAAFSEDFLTALDNNSSYVYLVDPNSYEVLYNNLAIRRERSRDYVGETCYHSFMGQNAPCKNCPIREYYATGHSQPVEMLRPDGRWLLAQASPLHWNGKDMMMLSCTDITVHRQASEELLQKGKEYAIVVQQSGKKVLRYDIKANRAEFFTDPEILTGYGREIDDFQNVLVNSPAFDKTCRQKALQYFASMERGELQGSCDLKFTLDEKPLWLHSDYTLLRDSAGEYNLAIISFFDNTVQYEKQLAYDQWRKSFTELASKGSNYVVLNLTRDIVEYTSAPEAANRIDTSFTGFLQENLELIVLEQDQKKYSEFFSRKRLLEMYRSGVCEDSLEYRAIGNLPEPVWFRADISLVKNPATDEVKSFVVYTNIDRSRKEIERYAQMAAIDSLTGILNREATHTKINSLLEKTKTRDISALFMIDLDNFKQINDMLGHQAGDELLKRVAVALEEIFRPEDVVGRVGGDEFMAFFTGTLKEDLIIRRASEILEALVFSTGGLTLTASVGVSVCLGGNKSFENLYTEADTALYHAKNRGKNQYHIAGTGDMSKSEDYSPTADSSTFQLKTLFEYMDGGIILAEIIGDDVHIIYTSPSFYKSMKRRPEELGKEYENVLSLVYPKDLPALRATVIRTGKTGEVSDITYRVGKEGVLWRHLRAARVPVGFGSPPRVIGVVTDFTEFKRAEESLGFAEERYRLALSQTKSLIWEVDISRHILTQTLDAAASFGHSGTIFYNMPDGILEADVIHPDSEPEYRRMFEDIYAGNEGREYFVLIRNNEGGYVWTRNSFRLIRDAFGNHVTAIGVVEKTSNVDADMKIFEQEMHFSSIIEDSIAGAVRVNLTKQTVEHLVFPELTSRGHNPKSYSELCSLLLDSIADDSYRQEAAERLAVENLFKSYRQNENWLFSEFQRTTSDGAVRWTDFSLSLLRQPVSGDLYVFIYARDTEVSKAWVEALDEPAQRDPATMLFSKVTTRALINNAIRMCAGSDSFCAITCVEIGGLDRLSREKGAKAVNELLFFLGRVYRSVVTGHTIIGRINESQLLIFRADISSVSEQQRRVESSREHIREVLRQSYPEYPVELYYGFAAERISTADTERLYGKAELACRTAKQWSDNPIVSYTDQTATDTDSANTTQHEFFVERKTILVADDDHIARVIMRNVLEPLYNVVEAENGVVAMEMLRTNKNISLVFLDLVMPEMNGWEVLEAVSATSDLCNTPIIVVTADGEADVVVKALDCGAMDVITKPYQPVVILSRVRNTLSRSEAARVAMKNRSYEMRLQQQASLLRTAERDELTGLYNKQAFYRIVRERITAEPACAYIMLRFDIDRFKIYNELFGTEAGDKLLRDAGAEINARAPEGFLFARMESDHFACFVNEEHFSVGRFTTALTEWLASYNKQFKLTASVGAYEVDEPNADVSLMCDRALMAERTIKNSYTDKFAYYDSSIWNKMLEEQRLTAGIDEGISKRQITPFYQPQYNQITGELVGAEALARWIHPEQGLISPASFIPVFENNGLITKLDAHLWEEVCKFLRSRLDAGEPIVPISVNISRRDFYRLNLVKHLTKLVKKYGLTPDMLRLEVTETAYMDDPNQLVDTIIELQKAGFFIEMDDFGSGYSSLNTLKNVPVDLLKLDMRFLETSDGDGINGKSGIILNSIITMASWLDLPVLAEGVETARQASYLRTLGCDLIQGYLFSKPLSEADFRTLLDKEVLGEMRAVSTIADFFNSTEFWDPDSQSAIVFNSFVGAAGIFEYHNGILSALRVNDKFFDIADIDRKRYEKERSQLLNTIHPDDHDRFIEGVGNALETMDEISTDVRWAHWQRPGEFIWLHFRIRKIGFTAGRYLMYVAIENITERKLNEARLAAQAKILETENLRSRLLLERMGIGTLNYDAETDSFHFETGSPQGSVMTIERANYLETFDEKTLVHPKNAKAFREVFSTVLRNGGTASLEFALNLYGDGYHTVMLHCAGVADETGKVSRVVGLISEK